MRATGLRGRPPSLNTSDIRELERVLTEGPLASGFTTDAWSLSKVCQVVADRFEVKLSESQISRILRGMNFPLPHRPRMLEQNRFHLSLIAI